jgi:flagellar assembly protein FliH
MMNMSSSSQGVLTSPYLPSILLYPDVASSVAEVEVDTLSASELPSQELAAKPVGPDPEEIAGMIASARASAVLETEARLRADAERREVEQAALINQALGAFAEERRRYFDRVESDVVHLALAIAAKILHREAQVDPMLVAALVKVAVSKLHDGSSVTVRVAPEELNRWTTYMANPTNGSTVHLVEDSHLQAGGCVLETDLGSANFGIDAQLKEVEQGFFDLLAQRPAVR